MILALLSQNEFELHSLSSGWRGGFSSANFAFTSVSVAFSVLSLATFFTLLTSSASAATTTTVASSERLVVATLPTAASVVSST